MAKKTSKSTASAGPSQVAITFNLIQAGLSEEKLVFQLIHLWEARNPRKAHLQPNKRRDHQQRSVSDKNSSALLETGNLLQSPSDEELVLKAHTFVMNEDDSDWSHETGEKGNDDDDDDKVTRLLTAGSDLESLNVKECKAYLRRHGLRIKDESGEAFDPRSSFPINCKVQEMCAGDVCEEGSVLFTQKVHHKFDKMKKSGKIMGRRTVVGHVVKESYGTAKQQHSFTYDKTKHLDTYVNSHPVVDGGSIEEVSSPERVLSFPAIFTLPQVGSTMFGANVVGNTSSWTMNPKAELKTVSLTLPQMPVCAA